MLTAAPLDSPAMIPAAAPAWTALATPANLPYAAFVRGHVDTDMLATDTAGIIKAFRELGPGYAEDMAEILAEAGQPQPFTAWMRYCSTLDGMDYFAFCDPSAARAFPVTAVRFG